jgi:RNA polymerase sigma factor (sigma-70 family)
VPEVIDSHGGESSSSVDKTLELQRILHEHAADLLEYIRRMLNSDLQRFVDPVDVLQDVFFSAFQHVDDFEPRFANASYQWLLTITRHRVSALKRAYRASKRGGDQKNLNEFEGDDGVKSMLEELVVYNRTPSQSAMSHEIALMVQKAIGGMEPHYREAIQLRYIDGLSVKQSAKRMGRTEGAIFMLCSRSDIVEGAFATGGCVEVLTVTPYETLF